MTHNDETDLQRLSRIVDQLEESDRAIRLLQSHMVDFFDNNPVPMHQINMAGQIVRANKAELAFLGYEKHEYVGHFPAEFYPDRELLAQIMDKVSNDILIWQQPVQIRHKKGHMVSGLLTSSNSENGLTRCITMPTDPPKLDK